MRHLSYLGGPILFCVDLSRTSLMQKRDFGGSVVDNVFWIWIYLLLVGGFNHLEKYESQWEGLSLIYIYYGKKDMFQTTNQYFIMSCHVGTYFYHM